MTYNYFIMKRIQLFEFEDYSWFPNWLRTALTNLIVVFNKLFGVNEVLSKLLSEAMKRTGNMSLVDLGSGSGGAMPDVLNTLQNEYGFNNIHLTMTDLYPNQEVIIFYNNLGRSDISYFEKSVNASDLAKAPNGLKTMVNCFHHMRPDDAKKILNSAQENKQAILIYELSDNKIPLFIWWLFLPISLIILIVMVLFMTPFVKPLTLRQLVFTYLIPIIPLFYAWDGQASMPRTYTISDYDELLDDSQTVDYSWEKGFALNKKNLKKGTYLLGIPK